MANLTKKDQMRYIELGNYSVDFNDGDIMLLDSVKDISPLFPLEAATIFFAVCTKGRQRIAYEDNGLDFTEGDIMLCPPKVRVTIGESSSDFDCKVLCISDHIVRGLLHDKSSLWHHESYIRRLNIMGMSQLNREEMKFYFNMIRSKLKQNNPVAPYDILLALLRALLLELHYMLFNDDGQQREQRLSQSKLLFNRFLSLVSTSEVKRQPIATYASQLAITPKYLTMLCLKFSNKTASEWVAQYTVEEIRFYLKSTDMSIKEISAHMGFSNMSHFGSYVRKHLGVSPSEYRYSRKG